MKHVSECAFAHVPLQPAWQQLLKQQQPATAQAPDTQCKSRAIMRARTHAVLAKRLCACVNNAGNSLCRSLVSTEQPPAAGDADATSGWRPKALVLYSLKLQYAALQANTHVATTTAPLAGNSIAQCTSCRAAAVIRFQSSRGRKYNFRFKIQ